MRDVSLGLGSAGVILIFFYRIFAHAVIQAPITSHLC